MQTAESNLKAISRAFTAQSAHFDQEDQENIILQHLRQQVYNHVEQFLPRGASILELNGGTGIDALHFARQGHPVHVTDLSVGMIEQLKRKFEGQNLHPQIRIQQLSFFELEKLKGSTYDFIFSNFGGLNCTDDLSTIAQQLPSLMNSGAHVTFVVMPPICPWEILSALKGNWSAFRRMKRQHITAHLEGEYFNVWYHSLASVQKAMGLQFKLINVEGLASLSPPPYAANFAKRHPSFYTLLRSLDRKVRNHFPFNRWADHLIITFQFT